MSLAPQTCEILGSRISLLDCHEVVDALIQRAQSGASGYVCVSNVHTVVEGQKDPQFQAITNGATMATADGVPLVWVSRFLGASIHGRASGPDVLAALLESEEGRRIPQYFVGSTPEVIESLRTRLHSRYSGINIVGCEPGPMYSVTDVRDGKADQSAEHLALIERIRRSGARLVWVGLGAPKQEYWMALTTKALPHCTLVGVGAAFDFLSGNKSRAPLWMQKNGLEWLHRWATEPRRLTGRYLSSNAYFLGSVALQVLRSLR